MLIPITDVLEQLNLLYTSVLIFVSFDTDAVCTLKILSGVLKSENILYQVYPVASYLQLEQQIETARCMEKVKMIFFINCGGAIDLTEKWFYAEKEKQEIKIFLLDVHKPIHHANIAHKNIKVVNDGHSNFEKCPTAKELFKLQQIQKQQMESDSQEEILQYKSQPRQDKDDDEEVSPMKRKRQVKKRMQAERKDLKKKINEKIEEYYEKQYVGLPSSLIAFRLARDINKTSNDYLWLAMVGLTSLYLQSRMSKDVYDKTQTFFSSEMMKLNASVQNAGENIGSIYRQMDFRFTLLKHWSLYDSMRYSPYMVVRLKLWNEFGRNRMHEFITKIGVPLEQARQSWSFMPLKLQNDLKGEVLKKAEQFQLLDVCFNSFKRQVDKYDSLACADYCYAITAALQQPHSQGTTTQKIYEIRMENFWAAYQLLELGSIVKVKKFIESYKTFMKILITEAQSILEKSQINPCYQFLYVKFTNDTPQKQLFEHPFRLIKLGQLLMQMYHQKKKAKKGIKPVVISISNQQSPICTVAGIVADVQNPFGTKFIQLAEKSNFERKHDGFLANIIQIKKDDLLKFVGQIILQP